MKSKITIFVLAVLLFSACRITNLVETSTPAPNTPTFSAEISSWNVYVNPKYGYSIEYPEFYNVVTVSEEYIEIGDKVVISVWDLDPTAAHGDDPIIESIEDVQLSGHSAKLLTGYIGSIGGYIPQQYRRFIIERDGIYFVVTQYALGLHATEGDVTEIVQLKSEDAELFDNMVTTMEIP